MKNNECKSCNLYNKCYQSIVSDVETFNNLIPIENTEELKLKLINVVRDKLSGLSINSKIEFVGTGFKNEYTRWNGRTKNFEKLLAEKNYDHFVYIKFCCEDNKIIPLVAGKTGTINVNSNGTDVCFSTNPEHGKARRVLCYLNKSTNKNFEWLMSEILIISAKSKDEAFAIERIIQEHLVIFGA